MKRALIVVDVQQDFCEGGSLAVAGGADVAAAITSYIADHRETYAAVVATRDAHINPGDHFSDSPDYVSTWPRHCVIGTGGEEFHPRFDATQAEAVFDKGACSAAYSGFEGTNSESVTLADWLHAREITDVDVVGIATDHCVRATALDAETSGFRTRVLLSLTAGVAAPTTRAAVAEMGQAGVELSGEPVVPS